MQVCMLIYEPKDQTAKRHDPAEAPAYWGAWTAYAAAVRASGLMVGGNGLEASPTATTLRIGAGGRQVQDGPYADTREQLGGYFVLEVPDLETALDWASRCPVFPGGAVEIRPVMPPPAA
ncbi:hypothetical protein J5Y09_15430 [Roseomonas sp. PWR1]|uniref:YCII-related domain-containing protein n=1 Tax=Roseomonas nitratireducens TaxID=2820810 RepID=A0ABS4AVC7_9PROT|nr:YciI family protein [Neoroseomonas nitratireducens]MBP0465316.1 hypothetical protein [Neoroseomonas nitratireducens]